MRKRIVATSPEGREFVLTLEEAGFKDNLNRAGLITNQENKPSENEAGTTPGIPEEVQLAVVQGDLKQAVALLEKDGYKVDVSDLAEAEKAG